MSAPEPEPDPNRPETTPEPALSADDERMNAWLDRQLGPSDSKLYEQELAQDPERGKDARTLAQMLSQLRSLPTEQAPSDLLDDVQSDIRHRSRGRYFGYHWKYRFPYEALLTTLFLIVSVIVYVVSRPAPPKLIPIEAKTFLVSGSDLGVGARILSDYGIVRARPRGARRRPVGAPHRRRRGQPDRGAAHRAVALPEHAARLRGGGRRPRHRARRYQAIEIRFASLGNGIWRPIG